MPINQFRIGKGLDAEPVTHAATRQMATGTGGPRRRFPLWCLCSRASPSVSKRRPAGHAASRCNGQHFHASSWAVWLDTQFEIRWSRKYSEMPGGIPDESHNMLRAPNWTEWADFASPGPVAQQCTAEQRAKTNRPQSAHLSWSSESPLWSSCIRCGQRESMMPNSYPSASARWTCWLRWELRICTTPRGPSYPTVSDTAMMRRISAEPARRTRAASV